MSKEKRLGRGLEALLGKVAAAADSAQNQTATTADSAKSKASFSVVSQYDDDDADQLISEAMQGQQSQNVQIEMIDRNPYQPRLDFDESLLADLASSIRQFGMIQPVTVRRSGERYELVAGERRLRAAKLAAMEAVPVYILDVDDREMAELALTENIQRKDLNAIEKAVAFHNYIETYGGTHEELGKRLGVNRSTVTNLMRLLDLPEELQQAVRNDRLSSGHARAVLGLNDKSMQIEIAEQALKEGWNVRQIELHVQELIADTTPSPKEKATRTIGNAENDPQIKELEQQFRSFFGMKVQLSANDKGKGKLVISFNSSKEFERIYQCICPGK